MDKPKEWWIHSTGNAYTRDVSSNFPVVHVIEKSAYDAVVKERDEMQAAGQFLHDKALTMAEQRTKERDEAVRALEVWKMSVPSYDALAAQLAEAQQSGFWGRTAARQSDKIKCLERALAYAKKRLSRSTKDLALVEIERLERGE